MTAPAPDTAPDATADALHPNWCWHALCETAGPVPMHYSAPIVWRMEGECVDVTMRRRQEGRDSEVLVEVHVANEAYPQESATLLFTEHDVDRLFTGIHELRGCR